MKFNKNEFGWKEKVSVNTDELVTKNDIPHYNEILITEISGDDYRFFRNNNYFNMSALNLDETKTYVGKDINITDDEEYTFEFVYDKETDALMCGFVYIYNHKSYNGENFVEDVDSAVLTFDITPMVISEFEGEGYFRLYEVEKLELDNKCLPDNVSIPNSLTVGTRIGDIGEFSVSEGEGTEATGNVSHAEGAYTIASGNISHAEGGYTTASGDFSHAEGDSSIASGEGSHAEGSGSMASGNYSHAENYAIAEGNNSHAEGCWTYASSANQHVQGKFNIKDTTGTYAHIVGNGTSNTKRSNAHTLDWSGNGWYAGKLTQEGTPAEDKDLTTKKYVDDKVAEANASSGYTHPDSHPASMITGLATVATSGSYNDLTNKPTIPSIEGLATETYVNNKLSSMPKSLAGHDGAQVLSYIDKHNILERENMIDKVFQVFTSLFYSTSIPASGDISNLSVNVVDFVNTIMNACTEFGEDIFLYFDFIFDSPIKFVVMPDSSNNMFAMIIDDRMTRVALQIEFTGDGTGEYTKTSTELVTKKYVDDTIASQPQISFNDSGELVVTINGVSKTFVPKQ